MTQSLLPAALALVLITSGAAVFLLNIDPPGSRAPAAQISASVHRAINDERSGAGLTTDELEARVVAARAAAWSDEVSPDQRTKLRQQIADDRDELRRRSAESRAALSWIQQPAGAATPPVRGAGVPGPAAAIANERNGGKLRLVEQRRRNSALRAGPLVSGVTERRKPLWELPAESRERFIDRR